VVTCGFKNGHQKDMCLQEIGLCVENMLTVLVSEVEVIRKTYMTTLVARDNLLL
jgi:hypothetical protein